MPETNKAMSTACIVLSLSLAVPLIGLSNNAAFAQAKSDSKSDLKLAPTQSAPSPAAPVQPLPKQITLTDKQLDSVLASQKDLDAVAEKLPEDSTATKPDPKVVAQLDEISKKYGFADYADYSLVIENISLILAGFDPQTKKYVGPEAVIKGQIAAVQADKKMPAKDRKEALAELNDALKSPAPTVENKANIDLVGKYYDKLAAVMQESDE